MFGLDRFAVSKLDDAVCDVEEQRVVCRHDRRNALAANELSDDLHDRPRVRGVELACRLVGDQELGPVGERAHDRHALLLPARELEWPVPGAAGEPDELKELAYALAMHIREEGITAVMTIESQQLLGSPSLSAHGVSFIADNLVQLRYVEVGSRLARAVSILKARGLHHDTGAAALEISSDGLRLAGDSFKDFRGVITGLPLQER